mgnify:CR=1 FL=1
MAKAPAHLHLNPKQMALVGGIVIVGLFLFGYTSRLIASSEAQSEVAQWQQEVDLAKQTLAENQARLEYAKTDAFVIEKAHSDVFNVLLQVLDDGRLTDSKGRTVNFKNTIIIMTSNLGNEIIKQYSIGFSDDTEQKVISHTRTKEMKDKIDHILREHFKLEFLNRIDEIVIFKSLSKEALNKIVELELDKVSQRLAVKGIKFKATAKLKKFLTDKGYDVTFGARPLKRVIQNQLLDELALQIIEGKIKEGETVISDIDNNKVVFRLEEKVPAKIKH